MTATGPLDGVGVLITRPRERAGRLAGLVEAAGGLPVIFPAIEILPPSDRATLDALLQRLEDFDWAIFISPTAVDRALAFIPDHRLPAGLHIAAVGKGSARALAQHGITGVLEPSDGADSEALLSLPAFARLDGQRVVIFRGEGGRELLGTTLLQRGAQVSYAECYWRGRPSGDVAPLLRLWHDGGVAAVTITSREALRNLADCLGAAGQGVLRHTPLFVLHERIAESAREMGITHITVAGPDDAALANAIVQWFEHGKNREL